MTYTKLEVRQEKVSWDVDDSPLDTLVASNGQAEWDVVTVYRDDLEAVEVMRKMATSFDALAALASIQETLATSLKTGIPVTNVQALNMFEKACAVLNDAEGVK